MEEKNMEEINMEQTAEKGNGKKRKKRGSCLLTFLIVFGIIFLFFVIFIIIPLSPHIETEFASIEEFDEYGGVVLMDIPENATDIKYYCNDMFFEVESAYSFIIEDEKDFNAFMEANEFEIHDDRTVEKYMTDPPMYGGEFPIRKWYKYVVEEDISDYIFLEYDSFDGSFSAILVDEESRRFVVIRHSVL